MARASFNGDMGGGGPAAPPRRRPVVGWLLIAAGAIGIITGVVPFTTNALRILVREDLWKVVDLAAHGVEAMGLSVEWGMLSSAMGACLGALLVWAGRAWRRGLPYAPVITWAYVLFGLAVNVTDMVIFAFRARRGAMRTQMLILDGLALLIPIVLAVWLIRVRKRCQVLFRKKVPDTFSKKST